MKLTIILITAIFFILSCQTAPSKVEVFSANQVLDSHTATDNNAESTSIRKIDFQNFTFPWTKIFGHGEKSFALKNGTAHLPDERKLTLNSLSYVDLVDDYDEQALVVIKMDDGNATYEMMYVYALENSKPKLLESFEFGEDNVFFRTAYGAHGELIIERSVQKADDAECCPSIVEISNYRWQENKFVRQGESKKIANGYEERLKGTKQLVKLQFKPPIGAGDVGGFRHRIRVRFQAIIQLRRQRFERLLLASCCEPYNPQVPELPLRRFDLRSPNKSRSRILEYCCVSCS